MPDTERKKNKKQLVCISTIDWNFLWQRHHTFMKQFLQSGWDVYFIENTGFRNPSWKDFIRLIKGIYRKLFFKIATKRNETNNIHIISPIVMPPNGAIFRLLNRKYFVPFLGKHLRKLGVINPEVAFVYLPSITTLNILKELNPKSIVFDCVANFWDHPHCPNDFDTIMDKLLSFSDIVITDSDFLYKKLITKHTKVFQLHHGVDIQLFINSNSHFIPNTNSYRSVCFFGGIDDRIDWKALQALMNVGARVTLIGTRQTNVPDGIEVLGPLTIEDLVLEIQKYDVLIIPYIITDFTKGIIPAKIFECMATGKPILVSPLPSLEKYHEWLYVCKSEEEYVRSFKNLIYTESEEKCRKRIEIAKSQSIEENFRKLSNIIHDLLEQKNVEKEDCACD